MTPSDAIPAEAQALWIERPGVCALRTEPLVWPADNCALVRTRFTAISRGTESLVFTGKVPESLTDAMRAPFQAGAFPGPVKYGYAAVGAVLDGPEELVERTVFCLYPHQNRFVVPAADLVAAPSGADPRRAALAANMETALTVLWDGAPVPGDRIAIVGAGVVGSLCAYLCGRIPGVEVTLIDIADARRRVAKAFGCRFATPDRAPVGCDLAIHASASEAGLATALACAGVEAPVVEASWYGSDAPRAPLGEAFHHRRLLLRSSQVGRIPPARAARWSHRRRLATALALTCDPTLDILLSGETAFDDLPAAYPEIVARPGALCHLVSYD